METEKDGAVQSDSIEQTDVAPEVGKEVEATSEPPKEDKVQWEALNKLISDRESAAKAEAERHFQSVKDREVAAEKRARLDAERLAREAQAHTEAQRELLLAGLTDPTERAEAERRYNAKVASKMAEINRPSPEQVAEYNKQIEYADEAKTYLRMLKMEYDIDYDAQNLKCSDPKIDMSNAEACAKTAKARWKELRNPPKPKETEPVKEAKPTKKAPKVDEGGSRGSSLSDEEFIKAYAKGEKNSPADHKRANKILTGG